MNFKVKTIYSIINFKINNIKLKDNNKYQFLVVIILIKKSQNIYYKKLKN
jgi:hypothetical protein